MDAKKLKRHHRKETFKMAQQLGFRDVYIYHSMRIKDIYQAFNARIFTLSIGRYFMFNFWFERFVKGHCMITDLKTPTNVALWITKKSVSKKVSNITVNNIQFTKTALNNLSCRMLPLLNTQYVDVLHKTYMPAIRRFIILALYLAFQFFFVLGHDDGYGGVWIFDTFGDFMVFSSLISAIILYRINIILLRKRFRIMPFGSPRGPRRGGFLSEEEREDARIKAFKIITPLVEELLLFIRQKYGDYVLIVDGNKLAIYFTKVKALTMQERMLILFLLRKHFDKGFFDSLPEPLRRDDYYLYDYALKDNNYVNEFYNVNYHTIPRLFY